MSRSTTRVRNCTASPRLQISTRSVSPGYTGDAKRVPIALSRVASPPQTALTSAQPVTPNEHRPCRIGALKPAAVATFGSACSGL